jgi:hypothetical protein
VCNEGWARFPARGTAGQCTISPALTLALCATSALGALSLLYTSVRKLHKEKRAKRATPLFMVPLLLASVTCLIADCLQAVDPTRVLMGDPSVTALKMATGVLINDVGVRYQFLRFRTVELAKVHRLAKAHRDDLSMDATLRGVERVMLFRTTAEVALCVAVAALCIGLSASVSTRVGDAICYWVLAVVVVISFVARNTRLLLETLESIAANTDASGDIAARICAAQRQASTFRRYSVAVVCVVILGSVIALVSLPFTDQWAHFFLEAILIAAVVGTAALQRAHKRIGNAPSSVVCSSFFKREKK